MRSGLVKSPSEECNMFSSTFQDYFIPWSMREQSQLRFKILTEGILVLTEYVAQFFEHSINALTNFLDDPERVH